MHDELESLIITESEEGQRLDKVLADRFQEIRSRTYFQMLFEEQKILVNGLPVKKRYISQAGDEIEVQFICTPEISIEPEPIPLDIIYEDESILLINKPAGMVVHPAAGNWSGTFVNALLYHCRHQANFLKEPAEEAQNLRPGIVHRLDKDTTGLLLAAKSPEAHRKLIEQFAGRQVYKEYRAICVGNPGNLTIEQPIGRHPTHRKMMAVLPDKGRKAVSICKTLAYNDEIAFVSVVLITGRTHQIRVHLKHCNAPVLGDALYGSPRANSRYGIHRQLLHAHYLRFDHPITGKRMEFYAPLPDDMQKILTQSKLEFLFVPCSEKRT